MLYETSQALTDRLEKHYRKKQERRFTKTNNNNNKMEEVTCFKLCYPRPQVTLHKKKLGPVPEALPEERERAVLTSRWSALECPVLAHIARDIPTLTKRAHLSHATNLPILTANRRVGEGGFFTAAIPAVHGLEL